MGDNRIREWWVKCRRCGHEHRIANYGRRVAVEPDGTVQTQTTVHEANCHGWRLMTAFERLRWDAQGRPTIWRYAVATA